MKYTPKRKNGGRPRGDAAAVRHKTIGVRVNLKEWDALQRKAEIMGMSPARLLRVLALQKRLPESPIPLANRDLYKELMRLAVNFNQLLRIMHREKDDLSITLLHRSRQEVRRIQQELLGLSAHTQVKQTESSFKDEKKSNNVYEELI